MSEGLLVSESERLLLEQQSAELESLDLTHRQICDLELLLNGGFAPLRGFLNRADYDSVCRELRLADGIFWPMPITLDVPEMLAGRLSAGQRVALRDLEGMVIAILEVGDIWTPDRAAEASALFDTLDPQHPGVAHLLTQSQPVYVGGIVRGLRLPRYYDFVDIRFTPRTLRAEFARRSWQRVIAFQTRNPMHRAHFELTKRAAEASDAKLLLHPVVGMTKPGDVDYFTRVKAYRALLPRYREGSAMLSLLPLAMRMGGPREALWHALIRKNYGCTHFIVGRDHAGPGRDQTGRAFYGPTAAQDLARRYAPELGIEIVCCEEMVYLPERATYFSASQVPAGCTAVPISATLLRQHLESGQSVPEWLTFPEVAAELRRVYRPRSEQGFTIFFTGLSGSGKSTIANILRLKLLEHGGRAVTLLDGDLVRKHLTSELGFSREDRGKNVRRITFVAAEITRHGGVAICAQIAPYDEVRREAREMIGAHGGFIEVYLSTELAVCEDRDRKGLYTKARAGILQNFTGVSDTFDVPSDPELVIDTAACTAEEAAQRILDVLRQHGYLADTGRHY